MGEKSENRGSGNNELPKIHDKIFRQSMTELAVAQDFFTYNLPEWVRNIAVLQKLELQPDRYPLQIHLQPPFNCALQMIHL